MAPGLITQSGAGTVRFGTAGVGVNGRFIIQVTAIANPATVKGRLPNAGTDVDLKVRSAADPDAAMAATIAAAGIYYVDDLGVIDVAVTFGAGGWAALSKPSARSGLSRRPMAVTRTTTISAGAPGREKP